jgi:pimeloyl-ACP methyl ester carboxylesterase
MAGDGDVDMTEGGETLVQGKAGKIAVWEKRPAGEPRGTVLPVHGATYSGPVAFDFSYPGGYSVMEHFVDRGFATATLAIRGYGNSEGPGDGFTIDTNAAVEDVGAVADYLARERGVSRPHIMGWSWGGVISTWFASRYPDRVDRLALMAGGVNTGGRPRPAPPESYKANTPQSVLDRIEIDLSDPAAREAFAAHVEQANPRSPTGVFFEIAKGRPPVDPASITRPTIIVYGANDGLYNSDTIGGFFSGISSDDKSVLIVPAAGHFLHIQKPRQRVYEAIARFLAAE